MQSEHILVIEDDHQIRDLLRRGLAYENYKVTVAADGATGLSAARDTPPDLVILDWMMPLTAGSVTISRTTVVGSSTEIALPS